MAQDLGLQLVSVLPLAQTQAPTELTSFSTAEHRPSASQPVRVLDRLATLVVHHELGPSAIAWDWKDDHCQGRRDLSEPVACLVFSLPRFDR